LALDTAHLHPSAAATGFVFHICITVSFNTMFVFSDLALSVWDIYLSRPPVQPVGWVAPKGFASWPVLQLQMFADYVQEYWFQEMPLSWWNHWSSQTDRTTNVAEAFHSVLSKLVIFSFYIQTDSTQTIVGKVPL
jgi:hypothetical protein